MNAIQLPIQTIENVFGKGLEEEQLSIIVSFFCLWTSIYLISGLVINNCDFEFSVQRDKKELKVNLVSFVHAVISSALSLTVVMFPDKEIIENPYYGYSRRVMCTCAISASYFLWDVIIVVFDDKIDLAFLFHGVACFLCYSFALRPFLSKFACWFLLYELSTPFLNVRNILLITGKKDSDVFRLYQTLFGVTFFAVRILYGIPVTILLINETLNHMEKENFFHNYFVAWYCLVAAALLCFLNIYWFSIMLKKAIRVYKKKIE